MIRSLVKRLVWPGLEGRLETAERVAGRQSDSVLAFQKQMNERLLLQENTIKAYAALARRQSEELALCQAMLGRYEKAQAEALASCRDTLRAHGEGLLRLEERLRRPGEPHRLLSARVEALSDAVPLSWVRSSRDIPLANLGDALSPLVVSVLTGRPVVHRAFTSRERRLVAVGTIGQAQSAGSVHLWGTGVDRTRRGFGNLDDAFAAAPGVEYVAHAVRGPFTQRTLLAQGIDAPSVYGDPAWFLPRILRPEVEKTHELGVIPHISELDGPAAEARFAAGKRRYLAEEAPSVRLISTYHEPSWAGFLGKLREILSCRRIVSTSFHGLLLADAYRIPCLYFPTGAGGLTRFGIDGAFDRAVDHRFADFYRGAGRTALWAYAQPVEAPTRWDEVIRAVDRAWEPLNHTGEGLFAAFPLARAVDFADADWPIAEERAAALPW